MSHPTVMAIAVADIRPSCAGEADLTERLRKAFKQAREFWLSISDDDRFKAALAACLTETTDEGEKALLIKSSRMVFRAAAVMMTKEM